VTSASAVGAITAAPAPCTARAAISSGADGASAHASEAAPNVASPMRNTRRRPTRSPTRPAAISRPPKTSV
jgi:hypothetical protein